MVIEVFSMDLVDLIAIKLEEIQGPSFEISNSMEIKVKSNLEHVHI